MSVCEAITKKNQRCKNKALQGSKFCYCHKNSKNYTQQGKGPVADFFKKLPYRVKSAVFFKPRERASGRFDRFIETNGNKEIESINIGRTPVNKIAQTALNVLSLGRFKKKIKALGYDDIYHNYIIIKYKDGSQVKLEKNHIPEFNQVTNNDIQNLKVSIPVNNHKLTTKEIIDKASQNNIDFYKYDPAKQNCQVFVRDIVDKNNLLPQLETDKLKEIEPQQVESALNTLLPPFKNLPKTITNIASSGDKVLYGEGLNDDVIFARKIINGIL